MKFLAIKDLYVIDGSMISSNPGVNPSLSITAIAERAMSFIPEKEEVSKMTFSEPLQKSS